MPGRGAGRLALGAFFALFVAFLYGPTLTILVLSFQGPEGGLTFPMRGVSTEWFSRLFARQAVGDLGAAFGRSLALAALVTAVTVARRVSSGSRHVIALSALYRLGVAAAVAARQRRERA